MNFGRKDDRREARGSLGGGDDVYDDGAAGFTGFSDAQLTRMKRFYHDAQTGSEGKPLRDEGENDDRRIDVGRDTRDTTTSLPPGQTQFNINMSNSNNRKY